MVAKKTNKKEARKQVVAQQFGIHTVLNREALYNIVKKNALFRGTKDNQQLVTNALVALVGEGVLERTGSKRKSMYKIKDKLTSSQRGKKSPDKYLPPQKAAKAAPKKGLLTGLTSLSVQMIMLQKKIEDTLLSKVDNPKEAAELISEYVYVAGLMMQPQ